MICSPFQIATCRIDGRSGLDNMRLSQDILSHEDSRHIPLPPTSIPNIIVTVHLTNGPVSPPAIPVLIRDL